MHAHHCIIQQPASDQGFVLVGVVIFVLALTILGISLFGLSSYEAQFYGDSADRAQAFYDAVGGVERAKFVLATTGELGDVAKSRPSGVVSTVATQEGQSSGQVAWDPLKPITIRVVAAERDQKRTVETTFRPIPAVDYYKRLITTYEGLHFGYNNDLAPPLGPLATRLQTVLVGEDWQPGPMDSTWTGLPLLKPTIVHPIPVGPPAPPILDYEGIGQPGHWTDAQDSPGPDANGNYALGGGAYPYPMYRTWFASGDRRFALEDLTSLSPSISIKDTVIWMFQRGVHFRYQVKVQGGPTSCLILVAKQFNDPTQQEPDLTLWFEGGLTAPGGAAVILIADGSVDLEHFSQGLFYDDAVTYLSVYAGKIKVTGPSPGHLLAYTHLPGNQDPRDLAGGLIDRLARLGYLPGETVAGLGTFATVQGSWKQISDSNPN